MWLFTKNNFLSVVADRDDKDRVLIRARFEEDIEDFFSNSDYAPEVIKGGGTDYLYRAFMPKHYFINALTNYVKNLDYDNFKNSNDDLWRHKPLMDIWNVMFEAQEERFRDTNPANFEYGSTDDPESYFLEY